jgi:hypothetical protein
MSSSSPAPSLRTPLPLPPCAVSGVIHGSQAGFSGQEASFIGSSAQVWEAASKIVQKWLASSSLNGEISTYGLSEQTAWNGVDKAPHFQAGGLGTSTPPLGKSS